MNIIEVYKKFPTQKDCLNHLEKVRWNGKTVCPYCKSGNVSPMPKEDRHHCNTCNTSFSVTVGTIFHKTKIDLQKWFLAISLVLNAKKGLSARQLARNLNVNKNTAWFLGMRIRKAMADDGKLLKGIVEMNETYIGGKPRKGGPKGKRGRGTKKTPVVGMIERNSNVKVKTSLILDSQKLNTLIRRNIDMENSVLITDEYRGYSRVPKKIKKHYKINHQISYVNGNIHTNNIEGFWDLLKRGIIGQYHKVSIGYLQKYIDEFAFRYNNRNNEEVFELTLAKAIGGVK
jgi:transposase-like protein